MCSIHICLEIVVSVEIPVILGKILQVCVNLCLHDQDMMPNVSKCQQATNEVTFVGHKSFDCAWHHLRKKHYNYTHTYMMNEYNKNN